MAVPVKWALNADGGAAVTWSFASDAPSSSFSDMAQHSIDIEAWRGVVRDAFAAWESVGNLHFVEVSNSYKVDAPAIQVGFGTFGASNTAIGVAWMSEMNGLLKTAIVLSEDPTDEPLTLSASGVWGYWRLNAELKQVFMHEIGHAIGLDHSDQTADLMYTIVGSANRSISANDALAVRMLYGAPVETMPMPKPDTPVKPISIPVFAGDAYLRANSDVARAGLDAFAHHVSFGWKEGRDGAVWFDDQYYLARNADVARAGMDPLTHFLSFGSAEGRTSQMAAGPVISGPGFDRQYYLMSNADVAASRMDPEAHFRSFGWREGRDPNAWFDTDGYLAKYQDVAKAGVNPLDHYAAWGWKEHRDPSTGFDTSDYLIANHDVAAAGLNPLEHLLRFGLAEGREPVVDGVWG